MALEVKIKGGNCIEFKYKIKNSDGSITESSILIDETRSNTILSQYNPNDPSSIKKLESGIYAVFTDIIDKNNSDDYLYHPVMAMLDNEGITNKMLRSEGLLRNIYDGNNYLTIKNIGTRHQVFKVNDLQSFFKNNRDYNLSNFLLSKIKDILVSQNIDLNIVFTDGYIGRHYEKGEPVILENEAFYNGEQGIGFMLKNNNNSYTIFVHNSTAGDIMTPGDIDLDGLTTLNHELIHLIYDRSDKIDIKEITNLRVRVEKELEKKAVKGYAHALSNNSEFVSEYLSRPELSDNLSPELNSDILNSMYSSLQLEKNPELINAINKGIKSVKPRPIENLNSNKASSVDLSEVTEDTIDDVDLSSLRDTSITEDDEDLQFRLPQEGEVFSIPEELSYRNKDVAQTAKNLYQRFVRSIRVYPGKGGKMTKDYSISYSSLINIDEEGKNYHKLFTLRQGDLVYWDFKGKSIVRPVIHTSISEDGTFLIKVAVNDKDVSDKNKTNYITLTANEVFGFRKNFGIPKVKFDATPTPVLKEVYDLNKSYRITDDDGKLIGTLEDGPFYSFEGEYENGEDKVKYTTVRAKDFKTTYVAFNVNDDLDNHHLNNLKKNDLIKVSFYKSGKEKEDKKKEITYYTPVVKVWGDTVETVIQLKNGDYVSKFYPKSEIKGALLMKENHKEDLLEAGVDKLRELELNGGFFNNEEQAFKKTSMVRYSDKGERNITNPSWNDLEAILDNIKSQGSGIEKYSKWRSGLTDKQYSEMKLKDIKDKLTQEYYKLSLALNRRRDITSKLRFGDFVQLDRPKMKQVGDKYVPDGDKISMSYGMVISKNGDWLNVMVYRPAFSSKEAGKDVKVIPGKGEVYFKKVRVTQGLPEAKKKKGRDDYSQVYSLRAVYFDNTEHKQLIDYMTDLKESFKENWDDKKKFFDHLKAGEDIPEDLQKFSAINMSKHGLVNEESLVDIDYNDTGAKLSDRYDVHMFDPDKMTLDEKLYTLSKLKKGSVVLKSIKQSNPDESLEPTSEKEKSKAPYSYAIVVDFDDDLGLPIIGFYNSKSHDYTVMPAYPNQILGYGLDLIGDRSRGIEPHEDVLEDKKYFLESFKKFKASLYFDTKEEGEKYIKEKKSALLDALGDKLYVATRYKKSDGTIVMTKPNETHTLVYTPVIESESKAGKIYEKHLKDSDYWNSLGTKDIESIHKDVLWDYIKVGDVFTRKIKIDNKDRYIDYLLLNKTDEHMTMRSMHLDRESGKWSFRDQILFKYRKDPFDSVNRIHLHKSGRRYSDFKKEKEDLKTRKKVDTTKKPIASFSKWSRNAKEDRIITPDKKPKKKSKKKSKGKSNSGTETKIGNTKNTRASQEAPKSRFGRKASKQLDFKSNSPIAFKKLKLLGDKLSSMYNTELIYLNSQDIQDRYGELESQQRAFVDVDNSIVINTDYATLAEPIHEMGHLILDGLKKTDRRIYNSIIEKMKTHDLYNVIATNYPEYEGDEEKIAIETFLTVSGEYYNKSFNTKNIKDTAFVEKNKGFFNRIFTSIKNYLARLFGISDKSFFDLEPEDLLSMSFDDLYTEYNTSLINGDFVKQAELGRIEVKFQDEGYFKENSDLYQELLKADVSEENAKDVWLATKTTQFNSWYKSDETPKVYYRTSVNTVSPTKVEGADPVFVFGNTYTSGNQLKVDNFLQIKSVYSIFDNAKPKDYIATIEDYSNTAGIAMIGDYDLLHKNAKLLADKFKNLDFYVDNFAGMHSISYHRKPNKKVSDLKLLLFNNNILRQLC